MTCCAVRAWISANSSAISAHHHGADALVGEDLEQKRVHAAAVDDVGAGHAALERLDARLHLGDHAAGNPPFGDHAPGALDLQGRDEGAGIPFLGEDALHVGEHDQLVGLEGRGQIPGYRVRVDVIALSVETRPDGRDDGDVTFTVEQVQEVGVDGFHL